MAHNVTPLSRFRAAHAPRGASPGPIERNGSPDRIPQAPADVLERVRALEADLARLTNHRQPTEVRLERLVEQLGDDAARERAAMLEDLRLIVELLGSSFRTTRAELDRLREDVAVVRELGERLVAGRFELRLAPVAGPANGAAREGPDWSDEDLGHG